MTIPVMNFPVGMPPQAADPLTTGLMTGLQVYSQILKAFGAPGQMESEQKQSQANLENTQARTALTQEQMNQMQQPQPYKYTSPSGESFSDYQNIVNQFGVDSPEATTFKSQMDADAKQASQRANYYETLSNSLGLRYTPTTTRELAAANMGRQGIPSENIPGEFQAMATGIPSQSSQHIPTQEEKQRAAEEGSMTESEVVKKGITAAQANQRLYADAFKTIEDQIDPHIANVVKFSGIRGKTEAEKDKLLMSMGSSKTDPAYQDYVTFMNTELPTLANEFRRQMGGQATDYEGKQMNLILNPDSWDRNPELALKQWEANKSISEKVRANAYRNQSDMLRDYQNEMKGNKNKAQTISPADQQKLQKAPSEVINALGVSKVQMPSFNSKAEFQQWYSQQPPEAQAAIKRQLGGQ